MGIFHYSYKLVRTWWDNIDTEPYVAEMRFPTQYIDLSTIKIKSIRGLLAVYSFISTATSETIIISHWRSDTAYRNGTNQLLQQLGVSIMGGSASGMSGSVSVPTVTTVEGFQQQAISQPPKYGWLWRNGELVFGIVGGIFGLLAAVIGNIEKIRDPMLGVVLKPSIHITAAREAIDVLGGEEFETEYSVRNVSDWVTCDVDFTKLTTIPSDKITSDTSMPGPFIGLKPGASESVKIHGLAKNVPIREEVEVYFDGSSTTWAGNASTLDAKSSNQQKAHVVIWPRRTVGSKRLGEPSSGKKCRVDCQFMIGDEFAKGFEIQAQLASPESVRFDRLLFPGAPPLDRLPLEAAPSLIQIRWIGKDLKPKKIYQFSLFLTSELDLTAAQWTSKIDSIEIVFGRIPSIR